MNKQYTYKKSGVDLTNSNEINQKISFLRQKTEKKYKLLNKFGDFGAVIDLNKWKKPVIVSSCDGIGTKIKLLQKFDQIETIGKDLVAMNVNDIICSGAKPVLFFDYLASAKLKKKQIFRFFEGMIAYLKKCDCTLAGGEIAEMPGITPKGLLDVSGFCIGIAEKNQLIDKSKIRPDDWLVGFPSNGFHANGFSLIRKIFKNYKYLFSKEEKLKILSPTKLYWHEFCQVKNQKIEIKALAHITGGGLAHNLQRIIENFGAQIKLPSWNLPFIKKFARFISEKEMLKTFNMGIGFVAIFSQKNAQRVLKLNNSAILIGKITKQNKISIKITPKS